MYIKVQEIGLMDRRPVFENWATEKDAAGGLKGYVSNSLQVWANIKDRSGSNFIQQAEMVWKYDARVVIRYNPSVTSHTKMVYANNRYKIESLSIVGERTKRFMDMKVSMIEQGVVTSGTVVPGFGLAVVYDYTGVGDEDEFTNSALKYKTVFGAFKDGVQFKVIYSGEPVGKQVLYTPSSGRFKWSTVFAPGEEALIQYL